MQRHLLALAMGLVILLAGGTAWAGGAAYQAQAFVTAGADPTVWVVVKDSNGIGCGGVPVQVSITAGAGELPQTWAATDAGGTVRIATLGCPLGTTINVYCGSVVVGLSNSVIASADRPRVSTDAVAAWFDEARAQVYAALIDPVTRVMVSGGSMDQDDINSTDSNNNKRITFGSVQPQDAATPFHRDVFQGTYKSSNIINVNVNETAANPDAVINLSSLSVNRLLRAFAQGGVDPELTAVVLDRDGRGIAGVTVTASASGGAIAPASAMTDDNGVARFQQSGGSLGDTLTVSANLAETVPVTVITEDSQPLGASDQAVSWFERRTRTVWTAVVNRHSRVLAASTSDMRSDVYEVNPDNIYPNRGEFVEQTSRRPASTYVVHGGSEAGDLVRIYHYGTLYRYPGGATYNSGLYGIGVLTLPAPETRYLMAAAAGGPNPKVWAIVTDQQGNAVKNVPVTFALSGAGTLDHANTVTGWGGIAVNRVTGSAVGTTLTVSADGAGRAAIFLSNTRAPANTDRVYGTYDPETHLLHAVLVQPENNVMTDTFAESQMQGNADLDMTSSNGVNASIGTYFAPQTDFSLCQSYTGFGTIGAGDVLRLNSTFVGGYDGFIEAKADSPEYLLAFAFPGTQPEVWAVVMDNQGNAVPGRTVEFQTTDGSLDQSAGVTNQGGFFVARAVSPIAYGNTITVSSPGLPPVAIWPSPAANYAASDKAFMWFDPTSLLLRSACVEIEKNVLTNNGALSPANIQVVDNTPENAREIGKGGVYDQSGGGTPPRISTAYLCAGTPGVGDVIKANFYTNNTIESFITIGRLNDRYLRAYAQYGSSANCNVVAVVTDTDGVGIPGARVSLATADGTLAAPPPGGFRTGLDGSVAVQFTATVPGWYKKITVTTPDFDATPVEVITNNETDIQTYYKAVPYYDAFRRRLNTAFVHAYFNTMPNTATSIPIEGVTAIDRTSNDKSLAVSPMENQTTTLPGAALVAFGTNDAVTQAARDQIAVDDASALGSPDALVTLGGDPEKTLFAFGTSGPLPVTITAVVVDRYGNGMAGATVNFASSGTLSVTSAVTDNAGMAATILSGISGAVTIDAPECVSYTATVIPGAANLVQANSRVLAWYAILERVARAAVVNLSDAILVSGSNIEFAPQDMTPNAKTFALTGAQQQTASAPAQVSIQSDTVGQNDRVIINETTTFASPDSILTLNVPTAELVSSLAAGPAMVSVGQAVSVTMTVFNNGSPDALNVAPLNLGLVGSAVLDSGPAPANWGTIPGGGSRAFVWSYRATGPGDVIFTGRAWGTDAFSMTGVTSTTTASPPVRVQGAAALACTLAAPANAERLKNFVVTMTVANTGEAAAVSVTAGPLTVAGTSSAAWISGPVPATASVAGGGSAEFQWTYAAGDAVGAVTFSGSAGGYDANSRAPIAAPAAISNPTQIVQGALNLESITAPDARVFRGQKRLSVAMTVRNTSLMAVTFTASALTFNGSQDHFTVWAAAANPRVVEPLATAVLHFTVDIGAAAPLGAVVINGSVSGDSPAGAMAANGAQQTATWQVQEAYNQLKQNYPNPLRLSQQAFTTFEFFLREEVPASLKVYNLAGELVAVLVDSTPGVGRHVVQWRGDNGNPGQTGKTLGSGVYLAVLKTGDYQEMKKVVVIR